MKLQQVSECHRQDEGQGLACGPNSQQPGPHLGAHGAHRFLGPRMAVFNSPD